MPPKINAKAAAGRAAKEVVKAGKADEKNKIAAGKEDQEWAKGAKGKGAKDDKAAKDEATRLKKEELKKLTAAEEASQPTKVPKAVKKVPAPPKPSASLSSKIPDFNSGGGSGKDLGNDEIESFSASNIDDMLSVMNIVSEKTDKASMGSKAAKVEQHAERRFAAAFNAYKEAQLPILRKDFPGLRLQQYNEMMFKNFKKHEDNPFNQLTLAFDATKEDKLNALKQSREELNRRLRND